MKEEAAEFHERRGPHAMVRALRRLREINAPCFKHHDEPFSGVVTIEGQYRQVCQRCLDNWKLDDRVRRQREERARMRAR
jgi:hypothetical protein